MESLLSVFSVANANQNDKLTFHHTVIADRQAGRQAGDGSLSAWAICRQGTVPCLPCLHGEPVIILDTNVISEMMKAEPKPAVAA
jgi:hypothetical protein